MGNIITYLREYGDRIFAELPFNEVDNLVLAEISYLDLTGIVPTVEQHSSVRMSDAMRTAVLLSKQGSGVGEATKEFLQLLGGCARFGSARLSNLSVILDAATNTQFSALHITLGDRTTYVSFRGTDNSIVGWREDFNLSYEVVPSERRSAEYLARTMRLSGRYRVGGHSKGGTLAVYAALMCPPLKRHRIVAVYNNDGPGLSKDTVDLTGWDELEPLVSFYVPTYSVFGQLFRNMEPDKIVRSTGEGVMQHDGFTWQVEGTSFSAASALDPACVPLNETLHRWIEGTPDLAKRREFVEQSFKAFEDNGITKQTELTSADAGQLETILLQVMGSTEGAREVIGNFVGAGAATIQGVDLRQLFHEQHLVRGLVLFAIGLFFAIAPTFAAHTFGFVVGAVALVWLGKRILDNALSTKLDDFNKRVRLITDMIGLVAAAWAMSSQVLIDQFGNYVLGLIFLAAAFTFAQRATKADVSRTRRAGDGVIAAVCLVLGVYPMFGGQAVIPGYLWWAGLIMTAYGAISIVYGMWVANHPGEQEPAQDGAGTDAQRDARQPSAGAELPAGRDGQGKRE